MIERLRRDPLQGALLVCICAIHLLFLAIILIHPSFAIRKKEHKALIVKTIVPMKAAPVEKRSAPAAAAAPKAQKIAAPPAPAPTPAPVKKVETAAPPAPAKKAKAPPAPKKEPAIADKRVSKTPPAPAAKKTPPAPRAKISDSLLKELEESIAKIDKSSDKGARGSAPKATAKAAAPIALQIDVPLDADAGTEEGDYTDSLVQILHQALSLPDFGEVKIQLSLRQDGSVVKIVVLKAQSEKNRRYLEDALSKLRFPRFDGAFANKKEYTFTLTFCNE